ncbi:ABC transporter ATP-binding protein [Thalassotalea ponticola]|uniref:ABC transporter ATP-binding protein n=1 Tax=Thalassotalea ponticola TaxID=1523392 RepID=UPI0025B3BCBC|nr:ABC transporter ATP-binding protein [Thalassotalea ponticola]MDN3653461.1 ABC transporter ATP-binding protein [Thalassotalea ponticola]
MTPALKIAGLRKVYKGGFVAVKGLDLQVDEGDFFALLGPNGAGKSTTIGVVTSLVNKTEGQVEVFGHNIDNELDLAKSFLGLVPQEFNFNQFEAPMKILVNQAGYYGVPRKEATIRAEKYLKQLELWDKKDQPSRNLSGGMKRRLMIARALMHEPKVLILDEPTAGVDIELRRHMWDYLRQLNAQGITIILTTHYLEEAEMLCRNIAIIDKGRIVEHTSMKNLLAKLHVETFVFDTQAMSEPPTLQGYQLRYIDEHTIEVDVDKSQPINSVFDQLSAQGVAVKSMRNKTNRLEELFVRLVANKADQQAEAE